MYITFFVLKNNSLLTKLLVVCVGLKYNEKWNTDNQLVVDMSVEDKLLQGLKLSFVSSYNPSSNKKKGTVKTVYKNCHVNSNCEVDLDYAGPCIKASAVSG